MTSAPHPGRLLLATVIRPQYGTVTAFAKTLKMARANVSRLTNGEVAISLPMARRLEKLGHGTARAWLVLQMDWDLENAP